MCGEVHGRKLPFSLLHREYAMPLPGAGSADVHANVDVAVEDGSGGFCEKAGVVGATVSTRTEAEPAARETFPAASTDRTSSVCIPCASPE